ncbi:MAG: PCMD domain-containing protein [Bacteroidales bacterium]|nr:PCMD domain-containing protein [Bacteroidales bacterium]
MKHKFISTFLLLLLIKVAYSQQVPNGNFEQWYNESNYQNPQYWDTPNSTTSSLNIFTVTRETNIVQNGTSCAKIQSRSIFGTPIPGLVTLGDFNVNIATFQSSITGGYPFTFKPSILKGYYQYEPVNNDRAFIGVILLKQNGNSWDTLGSGNFKPTNTVLSWTPFTVPIQYINTQETPTHLNIIILSSDKDYPQPNSILYIDNLTFEYNNSITSVSNNISPEIQWTSPYLRIKNIKQPTIIEVFDITGKSISKLHTYSEISFTLPLNNIYFISCTNDLNTITKKIITYP